MSVIQSGKLIDSRVELTLHPSLERDDLPKVTSIVLHRTASGSAISTLGAYAGGQQNGAHFLIDVEGKVYQSCVGWSINWSDIFR